MLSVIIPVKDEPSLEPLLLKIHEVLADIPDSYEIIIAQGDRETKNYPYPQLPHQRTIWTYGDSLDRSILGGFSHTTGDKIIVMDADNSHPPEIIPKLYWALDSVEMVIGSRFVEGGSYNVPPIRNLVTWGCAILAYLAGSKLTDPMSGFFGIRRDVLDRIKFKPFPWKTALEIELKAKPSLKEIPIIFEKRTIGKSKTNIWVGLKIIWGLLGLIIQRLKL